LWEHAVEFDAADPEYSAVCLAPLVHSAVTVCLAVQLTVGSSLAVPVVLLVEQPEYVRVVVQPVLVESVETAAAAVVLLAVHPESAVCADVAVRPVRLCTTSLVVHSVQLQVVHYHRVPDWLDSVVQTVTEIDDASLQCSVVAPVQVHSMVVADYQHSRQVVHLHCYLCSLVVAE